MSAHLRHDDHDLGVGGPAMLDAVHVLAPVRDNEPSVLILNPVHVPGAYERFAKPAIDALGALALLLILSPVLLAVAIGVRAALGKGILYRQVRVGRNGEHFTMLKFRSMIHDRRMPRDDVWTDEERATLAAAPFSEDRRRTHKHPHDPRVTAFGGFIRRYSLDELPQLINVLRGELSLVGPRPELVEIVDRYEPWQHRRHDVKPGLTGLWQVTERDREGLMHLCVSTDLEYVNTLSFLGDLKILALTIPTVLGGDPGVASNEIA